MNFNLNFLIVPILTFGLHETNAQERQPLFRFGVVADVQYADRDNNGTRHYRSSPEKLAEAVRVFNKEEVDFVVSLGDFINDDFRSFDTVTTITRKLKMPLYHVLGNHDFSVDCETKGQVLSTLYMDRPYYSFAKDDWRMIVLNGNDISLFANHKSSKKYKMANTQLKKLKAEGAKNAYDWNGAIGMAQLKWLKNELISSQKLNEKVIIFCHYPLYPDEAPELLWNARCVRMLIENYPHVAAYFNGHVHVSQYFYSNGVEYVSFRGMVEEKENSFAIISVYPNIIKLEGHGAEISRILGK